MNSLFNYRFTFSYTLRDNIDINKLIKSIKTLNKINKIFKLEKCRTIDTNDNKIYIFIENNNITVNSSHLFYDGYSIFFILKKIDEIYKDEIKNHKFDIYDSKVSIIEICYNNIILLSKLNYKNAYKFIFKKNKKTIKIAKTNFNKLSSKEIIYHTVNKLGIKNYCLILNARKIHTEYENFLGNLVYFSNNININEDIRSVLENDEKINLEKKLNSSVPDGLLINSYLSFVLPSYVKKMSLYSVIGNVVMIHPINNDEKYIVVDYY